MPGSYSGDGASRPSSVMASASSGRDARRAGKMCINIMGDAAIGMGMDIETAARNRIGFSPSCSQGVMGAERDGSRSPTRIWRHDRGRQLHQGGGRAQRRGHADRKAGASHPRDQAGPRVTNPARRSSLRSVKEGHDFSRLRAGWIVRRVGGSSAGKLARGPMFRFAILRRERAQRVSLEGCGPARELGGGAHVERDAKRHAINGSDAEGRHISSLICHSDRCCGRRATGTTLHARRRVNPPCMRRR